MKVTSLELIQCRTRRVTWLQTAKNFGQMEETFFFQLLNVHGVNDGTETEIYI